MSSSWSYDGAVSDLLGNVGTEYSGIILGTVWKCIVERAGEGFYFGLLRFLVKELISNIWYQNSSAKTMVLLSTVGIKDCFVCRGQTSSVSWCAGFILLITISQQLIWSVRTVKDAVFSDLHSQSDWNQSLKLSFFNSPAKMCTLLCTVRESRVI